MEASLQNYRNVQGAVWLEIIGLPKDGPGDTKSRWFQRFLVSTSNVGEMI